MAAYQGGTVWLQVVSSFDGLQKDIRRGVTEAFAGAGVDKAAANAFKGAEREMKQSAQRTGEAMKNSFQKATTDRVRQMTKDFSVLSRSLGLSSQEFQKIENRLKGISKLNLQTVTGQEKAAVGLRLLRNQFQGFIDEADRGQRRLSDPARWNLGALRAEADKVGDAIRAWSRPDPKAAQRQAEVQRMGRLQIQAEREMGAAQQKRYADQQRAYEAMQRDIMKGVRDLDREQARAHKEQIRRVAEQRRQGQLQARAERENVQLDLQVDRRRIRRQMREIANDIRTLQTDIRVGADTGDADARISALQARLARLDAERVDVDVDVDTHGAMQQLRRLQSQVEAAQRSGGNRNLTALLDAGAAANSVRVFNGVLFTTVTLGPLLIPVLAAAAAGISAIGAAALGAVLGVGVLIAGLSGIGGAVGAMADLEREQRQDSSGAGAARDAAAERRQAVQNARSVEDAQRSLVRARRDGARAIADADRQVSDAERSLADAHAQAADAAEGAADRVADARRDLARANVDAAEAAEAAARRVRDAEQGLVSAQRDAVRAQRDLNAARREAKRDLEDLNNALDSARLGERSLEFQVEEAAVHLNVVLEDDQATAREKEKAQLRYDQAIESLEQQQLETKRLEADTAKANSAGIEGSDRVRTAKDRISQVNERIRQAEERLSDAREAQSRQAINSAQALADARERVVDAVAAQRDVAVDSARRIDDAERALADARRGRTQAHRDAAEQVADAQRGLARAHEDIALQSSLAATATGSLATAQDNLNEAMRGLSPAGKDFATYLFSLRGLLRDLRWEVQEGFLPGLQRGMSAVIDEYGADFVSFMGEIATVMGDLTATFGEMLVNDPVWRSFFAAMEEWGPSFVRQTGEIGINLTSAFAAIITAFAPFLAEMGQGFADMTADFADWAAGLEGSSSLENFFAYLRESAPAVRTLLGNVFTIMENLFIGLAPYADDLLDVLIGMTDWLADMDPGDLANLALSIGLIVGAVQALAGVLSIVSGVGGLIGGSLKLGGAVKSAVGGVFGKGAGEAGAKAAARGAAPAASAALGGLGGAAKFAGKRLTAFLGPVGLVISILWLAWDAVRWLDDEFNILGGTTDVITDGIGSAFGWLWRRGIKPVWELIKGMFDVWGQILGTIGNIVTQVFKYIIAPVFRHLWDNTIGPWWNKHVRPMLQAFGDFVKKNLPKAIRAGVQLIGDYWNGLLNLFRRPIRAAINIVWNKGIIGAFNWLADEVPGMTRIDPIRIPKGLQHNGGYADGGTLPGYTPGRDVHRFVSPTAGVLELSGGEPILRPEAGRVLGTGWVDGINAAARGGGANGVKRFLGYEAHADGGWFGDTLSRIGNLGKVLLDPMAYFDKLVDKSLSAWGVDGMFGKAVSGTVKSVPRLLGDWVKGLFTPESDSGGQPANAMGWRNMWSIVSSQFPNATLNSAFRPGAITAVGTPSYHGKGRAIDVTPSMAIFNWLSRAFPNSSELIFSPAGGRQIRNGQRMTFGEPTRGDHWDHIHWAMARGGILPKLYDDGGDVPPGLSLVANASGKVESTVTDGFMAEVRALGRMARSEGAPLVDARGSRFGSDPAEVARELDKLRADKMALTGVFTEGGV